MKKHIIGLLSILLAGGLVVSCSGNIDEPDSKATSKSDEIVYLGVLEEGTRFDADHFEKGDTIGVFVSNYGSQYTDEGENAKAIYDGSRWVFERPVALKKSDLTEKRLWVNAYYPYGTMEEDGNVRLWCHKNATDVLTSKMALIDESGVAKLSFRHALSKIVINVRRTDNAPSITVPKFRLLMTGDPLRRYSGFQKDSFYSDGITWGLLYEDYDYLEIEPSGWTELTVDNQRVEWYIAPQLSGTALLQWQVDGEFKTIRAVNLSYFEAGRTHTFNILLGSDQVTELPYIQVSSDSGVEGWIDYSTEDFEANF